MAQSPPHYWRPGARPPELEFRPPTPPSGSKDSALDSSSLGTPRRAPNCSRSSRNALENYAYSLRNSLNDEKLKEKIPVADKKVVDDKVTETIQWLDAHQSSEKEEYESKQNELEAVANPVLQKVYAASGGAESGMPGSGTAAAASSTGSADQGPKIEEVD
ncbi:hypothetical protein ON010_g11021 [Phytophthora cinnamomi]|nr:hypothetical protein ON010_g11021 [Phytophthora cinnamomi]